MKKTPPRILSIAGSDCSGGAGIQADIKAITVCGGYASTAITALTAQNTQGVFGIHEIPNGFIAQQIDLILSDIGADIIKTGMLCNREIIETISYILEGYSQIPMVIDPVMISTSGSTLLDPKAIESLKELLIARALVVTPNIPEAEVLYGKEINSEDDVQAAAEYIKKLGAANVIIKGGHFGGGNVRDSLLSDDGFKFFTSKRIETNNTHGTGCSFASALSTFIAKGISIENSVQKAHDFVHNAILTAPDLGKGCGPINFI
ncbi:bifunctional hydroxymethylpyrimidine kinase/phosphomethylpyrimidine kinase [Rickettsiales bacterium]|nr:bifunctional hydroxymethylpyrimidine kinase/phosphomethylpyrimidine kinase [Rickettsiales bacterium]